MRNSIIIVVLGIALTAGALAVHAQSVKAPDIGTANPAPPSAASDIGQPDPPKPVLGGNAAGKTGGVATDKHAVPPFAGTDTSTAAPGGHAESSANGALSSPPNGEPVDQTDDKKPAGTNTKSPQDKAR